MVQHIVEPVEPAPQRGAVMATPKEPVMKTFRLSLLALMATAACLSVNAQPRMGTAAPQNFGPASF